MDDGGPFNEWITCQQKQKEGEQAWRLPLDFHIHKIWKIATCMEPAKSFNNLSEDCILASNRSDKVSDRDNSSKKDAKVLDIDESLSLFENNNTASNSINPSKNEDEVLNLRVVDFFQQAALIWYALQGTSAESTLTDIMLWLAPAMDRAEANNSKMKVSRLAKNVDLDKVFKKDQSRNNKAPWHVATVWLSLCGTPAHEESSIINIWKMLDPSMPEEDARKNRMKLSRLGMDLNFGQLWKTSLTNGVPSTSPKKPSKINDPSDKDSNWVSDSESTRNEYAHSDNPSDSNSMQLIVDKHALFLQTAAVWNSLCGTPGKVSHTKAIIMVFPGMTTAEAKQSKMKVSRLAKISIGNVPSAASQRNSTRRTKLTALLTTLSDPALGTGETKAASHPMAAVPNNIDKVDEVSLILAAQLVPMLAPPTLPILQVSIPSSIDIVSKLGDPSVASNLLTSSTSTFTFSVQDGGLTSTSSSTSSTSTCQSCFGNGH
jgi:hypothetical protein